MLNLKKKNLKIKALFILTALAFVFLFVAQTANAQEGEYMQGGMGFLQNFLGFITGTVYYVAGGMAALYLTTSALQWLINNQTHLISFDNSFVVRGLQVTQSLADMLLLLAFVVAAFGIIFKLKEFEAKKTIGNLVMVAILTRFGPLAVKMIVDIGNVAINTIVGGNDKLLEQVTSVLLADMLNTVGTITVVVAANAILLAIPWINILALGADLYAISSAAGVALGYNSVAINLAGNATLYFAVYYLIKMLFLLIVSYTLSGVYLIYITVFAQRIFMIQILTVISPLAIFSLALPQTSKYFKQWRDSLFKWTFTGIWTLFFLMLGIGSTGFVFPENPDFNSTLTTGVFAGMGIDQYMLYYIFLIIYLTMVSEMAQKDLGMGAMFRSAMIGVGAAAYTHMVKPVAGQIQDKAIEKYSNAQGRLDAGSSGIRGLTDKMIVGGSGLLANATDDKTMSSWRSIFAGDKGSKASAAATSANSMGKLFNAGTSVDAKLGDIDKDLTMNKALAKRGKLSDMEAISILQRNIGKKGEEANVQQIVNNLGKEKSASIVDAMVARNRLTPTQIKDAYSNGFIGKTDQVVEAINKQDYNGTYLRKVQKVRGGKATTADEIREEKEMRMMAIVHKDTATKKDAFQGLSARLFQNSDNSDPAKANEENMARKQERLAILVGANGRTLGNAMQTNQAYYDKLVADISEMEGEQLKNFAAANPDLLKQMYKSPRDKQYLPKELRIGNTMDGEVDPDKLSQLIGEPVISLGTQPASQTRTQTPPQPAAQTPPQQQTPPENRDNMQTGL